MDAAERSILFFIIASAGDQVPVFHEGDAAVYASTCNVDPSIPILSRDRRFLSILDAIGYPAIHFELPKTSLC
jgi:hypothetical protein